MRNVAADVARENEVCDHTLVLVAVDVGVREAHGLVDGVERHTGDALTHHALHALNERAHHNGPQPLQQQVDAPSHKNFLVDVQALVQLPQIACE